MALQIWLPLTGTVENKGLYPATFTNATATVNPAGKIGSCYNFAATTGNGIIYSPGTTPFTSFMETFIDNHSFSFCAWFKMSSSSTAGPLAYITYGVGFVVGTTVVFNMNNSARSVNLTVNQAVNDDKWHHYVATYDYESNKMSLYIDGVLIGSKTYASGASYVHTWVNNFYIGRNPNTSTATCFFQGGMNDVRFYDHCLSPKEVKEISQALVFHLPLRDPYVESTTNLLGTKSDDFSGWSSYGFGGKGVKSIPADISPAIIGQVCRVTSNGNNSNQRIEMATSTSGPSLAKNETITVSAYVKGEGNSIGKTGRLHVYNTNGTNTQSTVAVNFTFTGEWQRVSGVWTWGYDNASGTSFNLYVVGYINNGESYLFSNVQIEAKDHVTPWTEGTRVQSSVYDCSGYGHHGTITGSLTTDSNTKRYDVSTHFPTINDFITVPMLQLDEFTYTFWFKRDRVSQSNREMIMTGWYGVSFELNTNNTLTFRCQTSAGTKDVISTTTFGTTGVWNHVAMVRDPAVGTKIYINGVLEKTTSWTGTMSYSATTATIGRYSDSSYAFLGSLSDFRRYSTALSDTDIRELYDTAASINNLGGVHSYQFVEETIGRGRVKQTGQVVSDEFVEKLEYLYLPAGSCCVNVGPSYVSGDTCKAITVIRYETGGSASSRDLMGFSANGACYWGVTAAGAWEPHATFSYTDSDITKKNTITYSHTSTATGSWSVGCIGGATSWAVRPKYIYDVKVWKNNVLERHLIPAKTAAGVGLYDTITKTFYPTNTGGSISADGTTAKIYDTYIETSQLLEK